MFESPYSSDSDYEEYFSQKFPFYTNLGAPLVYYTEVKTTNDIYNKHNDKIRRNGFVRAFNCFAEDLTKKKGSIFNQSPQKAEAHFAKWLDEKYQEYLKENACCKPSSQATNVAYNEPSEVGCKCDNGTKNNRIKSPWYKRRSTKTAKRNNSNEQIEFILKPTCLLRPSSDCNHSSVSSVNRSCTTFVIKSHSCMEQTAQNISQLGASKVTGEDSVPDTIQKMKNGAVAKVGTHVNKKDIETQSTLMPSENAATQYGNTECPDCVYRFIKQVTEKPPMTTNKTPEVSQKKSTDRLNKFRNVICQCYNGDCKAVQTGNSQRTPKSKNKAKTKVDKCCCPYEINANKTVDLAQNTSPNYKYVPAVKHSNTSCTCPCRIDRGSCFKFEATVIYSKKHNASQTMTGNDNELSTANTTTTATKRESTLRNVVCYPIVTQNVKASVGQAQTKNTLPQSTERSSEVPGVVDQQISSAISKLEASEQTSDHSILFSSGTDDQLFLTITCPEKLNNMHNN